MSTSEITPDLTKPIDQLPIKGPFPDDEGDVTPDQTTQDPTKVDEPMVTG